MKEIDKKIVEILKEDKDLQKERDEIQKRWQKEIDYNLLLGKPITKEMVLEKKQWLEMLLELGKLKKKGGER